MMAKSATSWLVCIIAAAVAASARHGGGDNNEAFGRQTQQQPPGGLVQQPDAAMPSRVLRKQQHNPRKSRLMSLLAIEEDEGHPTTRASSSSSSTLDDLDVAALLLEQDKLFRNLLSDVSMSHHDKGSEKGHKSKGHKSKGSKGHKSKGKGSKGHKGKGGSKDVEYVDDDKHGGNGGGDSTDGAGGGGGGSHSPPSPSPPPPPPSGGGGPVPPAPTAPPPPPTPPGPAPTSPTPPSTTTTPAPADAGIPPDTPPPAMAAPDGGGAPTNPAPVQGPGGAQTPPPTGSPEEAGSGGGGDVTIEQGIMANADYSDLEDALRQADLLELLGEDGPYTVLAPPNDAFNAVNAIAMLLQTPPYAAHLRGLLLYHVVPGEVASDALTAGSNVETASGFDITVISNSATSVNLTNGQVPSIGLAVEPLDQPYSNGLIHQTDSVLLPPWMFQDLIDVAVADPQLSALVGLIADAVLDDQVRQGTYTILAPTNAAIANLDPALVASLQNNTEELQSVLLYHVIQGIEPSEGWSDGDTLNTTSGAELTVSVSADGVISFNDGQATVVQADVLASNGIIHRIDAVLVPPNLNVP